MLRRVLLIAAAVALMVAGIVLLARPLEERGPAAPRPVAEPLGSSARPIAAEADVFRIRGDELAVGTATERRGEAHVRTLDMFRRLRAFPGAPPRIPHGLTDDEFRRTRCNVCHERGGYSARFGAYAPLTPHPQYTDCLQCHVPDATTVGIEFPGPDPRVMCVQCHVLEAEKPLLVAVDWPEPTWPQPAGPPADGSPPVIPHDLHLRGNCLACHGGPAAVAEIRTTHPERANCRQCHVPAPSDAGLFTRPPEDTPVATGGEP